MAERVSKLARSLKDLHLSTSMDEAYVRAQEILLGNSASKENVFQEKTLNEIMAKKEESQAPEKVVIEEIIIDSNKETNSVEQKPEET